MTVHNGIPVTTPGRTLFDIAHRVRPHELEQAMREVVELDGYGAHGTRHAFEDDRERDRLLQLAGFRVVRVTWRQLHQDPMRLARDLRSLLRS